MRIVSWNIRHGGGQRVEAVAAQIGRWAPDVVALCEVRATPPSLHLARRLAAQGLHYQRTTADPAQPNVNRLLVASRWPIRRVVTPAAPRDGRWLAAAIAAPRPFTVGAMHVPNRVTGRKWEFLDAVLRTAQGWRGGPALLLGDTNSGRPGIDEESPAFNAREGGWIDGIEQAGWRDAFRHFRGEERAYTWYSPNGQNGFRIDQAFVNGTMLPGLHDARYEWGRLRPGRDRTHELSDHAALLLDLDPYPLASAKAQLAKQPYPLASPPAPLAKQPPSPMPTTSQTAQKGPDARRRPRAAREAYSLYVERAAEGANEADGPFSAVCRG